MGLVFFKQFLKCVQNRTSEWSGEGEELDLLFTFGVLSFILWSCNPEMVLLIK